jgi:D-glycerate 3-kinase
VIAGRALDPLVTILRDALAARQRTVSRRPIILGLCGAQGSGKSTLAAALENLLHAEGIACATLSLDDLYKTKAERLALARAVHPLFTTRGVPGTHDLELAFSLIAALERGESARLPRFDKSRDDRVPAEEWDLTPDHTQILIFEGWLVGAHPQPADALIAPINRLERDEDRDGRWRRHANAALAGDYQRLFARIDLLVLLAAPDFDVVCGWRTEQEHVLRAQVGAGMSDDQLGRFVEHYERLTRHILSDMPAYADIVIALDRNRKPHAIADRSR